MNKKITFLCNECREKNIFLNKPTEKRRCIYCGGSILPLTEEVTEKKYIPITSNEKEKIIDIVSFLYERLGHEKFHIAIKIFMDTIETLKTNNKEIRFSDLKRILEKSIEIAEITEQ